MKAASNALSSPTLIMLTRWLEQKYERLVLTAAHSLVVWCNAAFRNATGAKIVQRTALNRP